jgi:2-polyprenyl-3-methyl-5-hydroxy-6-metoxy-1,4-benzoquinol methylase
MIHIKTDFPVALDSNDHIYPHGTKMDNHTNYLFNENIYRLFAGKEFKLMDLGCAGGGMVYDFVKDGHMAIGLEGSDYCLIRKQHAWGIIPAHLFTCDISRPFEVQDENDQKVLFDVITAWDVIEHVVPERTDAVIQNIVDHLKPDGYLICSIPSGGNPQERTGSYGDPTWHLLHMTDEELEHLFKRFGLFIVDIPGWDPKGWVRGVANWETFDEPPMCFTHVLRKKKMIKISTNHPVAINSNDTKYPEISGSTHDNTTSKAFLDEVEQYFNKPDVALMDLGCAGGQLVVDFYRRNKLAVGLEGSDKPLAMNLFNWPKYANSALFTCDISQPYSVIDGDTGELVQFDIITCWETIEHMKPEDLNTMLLQVEKHLKPGGLFVGSAFLDGITDVGVLKQGDIAPTWNKDSNTPGGPTATVHRKSLELTIGGPARMHWGTTVVDIPPEQVRVGETVVIPMHFSIHTGEEWEKIIGQFFDMCPYPFKNFVRQDTIKMSPTGKPWSYWFAGKKKIKT